MIELNKLRKVSDILNSEGSILGLFIDPDNNLYLSSLLSDGKGTIYYSTDSKKLRDYLNSKLTLNELFKESSTFLVKYKFRSQVKTYLKEDYLNSLQCGQDLYKDIPESMKSQEIEKNYGS